MISVVEVVLAVGIALLAGWNHYKFRGVVQLFEKTSEGAKEEMRNWISYEVDNAVQQFEDLADEVIPEAPDPFEAMEIMRANMINQVLGMGVNWFAQKFTKVEMGVHQIENIDKPPTAEGEAWHDVDAEQQREELAEVADSM
jgi:hypothetical protein